MAKIRKIIFFLEWNFCKRDYDRFGIKILQDNGFEVEVWEFMPYLNPKFFNTIEPPDPISFSGQHFFFNTKEIKTAIYALDDSCFVVTMILYKPATYKIYRFLSKRGLKYTIYTAGSSYPFIIAQLQKRPLPLSLLSKMRGKLRKLSFKALRRYAIDHLPSRFLGIRPADLILAGAAQSHFYASPIGGNTEILCIHYLDYDIYLNEIKQPIPEHRKMAVFLDEYLPFHQDLAICNMVQPVTPEEYYPYLRKFFDYIEKRFGIQIIIAAHPRSHYEELPDYFGGRDVIRGQTAKLVRLSDFVIAHSSYSVNFAVLFKKPVIFLTTDILEQTYMKDYISVMAGLLNGKIININNFFSVDWEKVFSLDEEKYNEYRHCYIKKDGTEELPFWQIVANQIKKF